MSAIEVAKDTSDIAFGVAATLSISICAVLSATKAVASVSASRLGFFSTVNTVLSGAETPASG